MAKPGRKPRKVRPIKFGMTVYLVPGEDDRLIKWFDDEVPEGHRWHYVKEKLARMLEIEDGGLEIAAAQVEEETAEPEASEEIRKATAELFAKTQE